MFSNVVQPSNRTPQLITTRKVGRPDKQRPVASLPGLTRKTSTAQEKQALAAQEGNLYNLNAVDGFSVSSWIPTGQHIDTYA